MTESSQKGASGGNVMTESSQKKSGEEAATTASSQEKSSGEAATTASSQKKSNGEATASTKKGTGKAPVLFIIVSVVVLLLLAGVLVFLILHHRASIRKESHKREEILKAGPQVLVQTARTSPGEQTLTLQAEVRPFATATLYAKVSGYLREIRVDKGDQVTANQIMAVIEAPEIHRQYQAAVADERNKWATARRAKNLVGPGVVSVQEADLAMAQAQVSEANRKAQETQLAYEVLRAPFDGTVTARFADRGALVQNATNAQTGALPVVTVSQLDRLRVYVYLAQSDAAFVHVGDAAVVRVPERLGKTYAAQVTRVSGELDSRTRMMLTELDLDNRKGEILPGSFIEVSLKIKTPRYVEVPSEALVLRGDKTLVAVVTPENTVHLQEVKVGSDDGQLVRLLSGLNAGQKVALNLGDAVGEGKNVRPIEPSAPKQPGSAPVAAKDDKDKDKQKGQDASEQKGASSGESKAAPGEANQQGEPKEAPQGEQKGSAPNEPKGAPAGEANQPASAK